MSNFFDIQTDLPEPLVTFIPNIESPIKREMIENLFAGANQVFENINHRFGYDGGIPAIKVKISADLSPGIMGDGLIIPSGLIDHILSTQFSFIEDILDNTSISQIIDYNIINKNVLIWVLAHEHMHNVRKHREVTEECGDSPLTLQALEYDADLCGVATLYRLMQELYDSRLEDTEIKILVFYSIFWAIRTLPSKEDSNSHPPINYRFLYMIFKLDRLPRIHWDTPIEPNSPELSHTQVALIQCHGNCEIQYQQALLLKNSADPLEGIKKTLDEGKWVLVLYRWEEIKNVVARISNTRT